MVLSSVIVLLHFVIQSTGQHKSIYINMYTCVYHLYASLFMDGILSSSLTGNDIGAEGMKSLFTSASHFSSLTSLE